MAQLVEFGIGDLSRQTGVNIETIRYYERVGLLRRAARSAGGYRRYRLDDQKRLSFVRRSRELGFSLDEVRALLRLVDSRSRSCAAARDLSLKHLHQVERKLADLRRMERVLRNMIAQCSDGTMPHCPLIEALFGDQR